jgi:hypothetical protein
VGEARNSYSRAVISLANEKPSPAPRERVFFIVSREASFRIRREAR